MSTVKGKKNAAYIFGMVCGILAIINCFVAIGFSVCNNYVSIYLLLVSLFLLGLNRIGLHLSNFKENMIENIVITGLVFILALLVGFTKYSIYFLTTSMFLYSLSVIVARILKMKEDHSTQSIIFNCLCITFVFLFSFLFFFPAIYEKHATSVSNSNFIVMCYTLVIIVSSSKNVLFPYHHTLKLNVLSNIIKKSMVYEIFLALAILIVLCSVYFTIVEPAMTSYVDSLWYCFSVITTIGFGDVYVTTTFGRILSIILGISGIIVVALFTSLIVNFYNEMNKKREVKEVKQIVDEEEKEIKLEDNKESRDK